MTTQVQDYERQLSQLEGMTAQYQDLTRRVKEAEENYQLYQKKQEEARITGELDQSKITNVSLADVRKSSEVSHDQPLFHSALALDHELKGEGQSLTVVARTGKLVSGALTQVTDSLAVQITAQATG